MTSIQTWILSIGMTVVGPVAWADTSAPIASQPPESTLCTSADDDVFETFRELDAASPESQSGSSWVIVDQTASQTTQGLTDITGEAPIQPVQIPVESEVKAEYESLCKIDPAEFVRALHRDVIATDGKHENDALTSEPGTLSDTTQLNLLQIQNLPACVLPSLDQRAVALENVASAQTIGRCGQWTRIGLRKMLQITKPLWSKYLPSQRLNQMRPAYCDGALESTGFLLMASGFAGVILLKSSSLASYLATFATNDTLRMEASDMPKVAFGILLIGGGLILVKPTLEMVAVELIGRERKLNIELGMYSPLQLTPLQIAGGGLKEVPIPRFQTTLQRHASKASTTWAAASLLPPE